MNGPTQRSNVFFSLILCLSVLTVLSGCSANKTAEPDFIFLVTLDTTRADALDYSLQNNTQTPNLAELAAQGQYFENAFALIPITLPSHASMFYSLQPHNMKLYNNGQIQKNPRPALAQILNKNGYATGAVISLGVLKSDFGLNKGFDHYIENFKPYLWDRTADDVNKDAFSLVRRTLREHEKSGKKEKGFFWLHYSDPHEPYFPPFEDGHFIISLNGAEVFRSRSIEQPVVNVQMEIKPGTNTLNLDTQIPANFSNFPGCTVEYFKFRDFTLTSAGGPIDKSITVRLPRHWTGKKTNSGMNYYSEEESSQIIISNKHTETVSMTVHFLYSLKVDDATRRIFYAEEVRFMDQQIGHFIAFLKEQGIFNRSVFIVMGDHGEGLGEYRGHFGHIHYLNNSAMNVPLIIAGQGVPANGKQTRAVSTLNIAPTILQLAGIPKPGFMLGHSLLEQHAPSVRLLQETYSPEAYFDAFALVDFPYQLCFYPGRRENKLEFFNLQTDPQGINPIDKNSPGKNSSEKNNREKKRTQLVNAMLKISRIITATKGKIGKASKRHEEILKSLGYL